MSPSHIGLASYLLTRTLTVIAISSVVGLGLGLRDGEIVVGVVYSQAIAVSIWLCFFVGRFAFKRDPESGWPKGWRRGALTVASIPVGYLFGSMVGDAYSGRSHLSLLYESPRLFTGYLFVAVVCSVGIMQIFYTRGRRQKLEQLVALAQRDAAENQLKLLSSQLEPHMLFNTLANLRVLIATDPGRAQVMLDHVVSFMRSTLTASRNMLHPLSAEFARLDDYLSLMKVRMGDRLQTRLDLPDTLVDMAVPTLLLQPLVENAIKHGLEPHIDGGRLVVTAARDGADLLLSVRDTGVGLSGSQSTSADGTHFGMVQIRERLDTLYGPVASLQLTSPEANDPLGPGGTLAIVRIPLNRTA